MITRTCPYFLQFLAHKLSPRLSGDKEFLWSFSDSRASASWKTCNSNKLLIHLTYCHLIVNCGVKVGEELDRGEALWPGLLHGAVTLSPGQGRGHMSGHVGHAALRVHSDQAPAASPLCPSGVSGEHHSDTEGQVWQRSSETTIFACAICWVLAGGNCPLWLRYWSSSGHTDISIIINWGISWGTCSKINRDADVVACPEMGSKSGTSSNPSLSKQIRRGCKGEKGFYITT